MTRPLVPISVIKIRGQSVSLRIGTEVINRVKKELAEHLIGKSIINKILKEHPKGMAYAHLLSALKKYPILVDEAGTVLSMPPIINSESSLVCRGTLSSCKGCCGAGR